MSDLAGITHDAIAEYLACLRVDHCASTYNNRVCVLREIFHILAAKAGIDEDPWEGVKLRPDDSHSRRELTVDELKRLMSAAEKEGAEWKTLFTIGVYTGLRLGDCCRLEWRNVNMLSGIIQLIPRKTKRYSHGRPITIPLHPALAEILNAVSVNEREGFVIPSIADAYMASRWRISQGIAKIFNAGVPLHIVQSIVGHESTAMTRHYYHENVDSLRMAVNAIPAL